MPPLRDDVDLADEKRLAGERAAALVQDGMRVGLGTGSTVAYVLEALGRLRPLARYVATSPRTAARATELGLHVERFEGTGTLDALDLAIDGADEVTPDRWLVKGRGGAHTREKVVAAAAADFVVVVDSSKLVDRLGPPVPIEVLDFGLAATLRELATVAVRDAPRTPDGNVLADYLGEFDDAVALEARFAEVPGVVSHGLFSPRLVTKVLVGREDFGTAATPGGTW
jgi:ribose 5-phosphate isomerase A